MKTTGEEVKASPDSNAANAESAKTNGVEPDQPQEEPGLPQPYSIGKYVQDHEEETWGHLDTHEEIKNTWLSHELEGPNDWKYRHNRLTKAGESSITARFKFPGK